MALASRREVVLLSSLCPWSEGDCLLQREGSWRATLPALCCGKEGLKMAEETGSGAGLFTVSSCRCCCRCCNNCGKSCVDRQEILSWGGGEEETSKEYKDVQPKLKCQLNMKTLMLQCPCLGANRPIA